MMTPLWIVHPKLQSEPPITDGSSIIPRGRGTLLRGRDSSACPRCQRRRTHQCGPSTTQQPPSQHWRSGVMTPPPPTRRRTTQRPNPPQLQRKGGGGSATSAAAVGTPQPTTRDGGNENPPDTEATAEGGGDDTPPEVNATGEGGNAEEPDAGGGTQCNNRYRRWGGGWKSNPTTTATA